MRESSAWTRAEPAAARIGAVALLAASLFVRTGGTAGAQSTLPTATSVPCVVVDATLDEALDSGTARVGRRFTFTLAAEAGGYAGAHGTGIVDAVKGAKRGGAPGELGIEARFIETADGAHLPALLFAIGDRRSANTDGATRNAPVVLSAVGVFRPTPYQVVAALTAAYNFIHFGGQASLTRGTPLRIVLGDDALTGRCALPAER